MDGWTMDGWTNGPQLQQQWGPQLQQQWGQPKKPHGHWATLSIFSTLDTLDTRMFQKKSKILLDSFNLTSRLMIRRFCYFMEVLKRTYGMYKFRLKRTYCMYKFRLKRTYVYKIKIRKCMCTLKRPLKRPQGGPAWHNIIYYTKKSVLGPFGVMRDHFWSWRAIFSAVLGHYGAAVRLWKGPRVVQHDV